MPLYEVSDDNGNKLTLEGDAPPTEQELEEIFSQHSGNSRSRIAEPTVGDFANPQRDYSASLYDQPAEAALPQDFTPGKIPEPTEDERNLNWVRLQEQITPGTREYEKGRLASEQMDVANAELPTGVKLGTAAHTGLLTGMHLPTRLARGAVMLSGLDRFVDWNWGRTDFANRNREYFKAMDEFQQRSRELTGGGAGVDLTTALTQGVAELPIQLLSGGAGMAAGGTSKAVEASALAAGAIGGLSQFGQEMGEGSTWTEAATRGLTSGLITGLTTRAFGATGVESIFKNEGTRGVAQRLLKVAKEAGAEGAEEMTDQLQQELVDYINKNPDKPIGEAINNVLVAGAVGTALGGGIGLASTLRGKNASQVSQAAKVHGDVRAQTEGGLSVEERSRYSELANKFYLNEEMSAAEMNEFDQLEGRAKAQMQAGVENQPVPQGMISEAEGLLQDAIKQEGVSGMVDVVDPSKLDPKNPMHGRIAQFNQTTGRIEVNGRALAMDLQQIPAEQRAQVVRSVINEELVHSYVPNDVASEFHGNASWVEKLINRRIYTGRFGKTDIPDVNLGHEMIRRRIQRLNRMTPTEIAWSVGREKWTLKSLDAIDNAIAKAREALGTKASQSQRAALDHLQSQVGVAREAVGAGAGGGGEDDRQIGSLRRFQERPEDIMKMDPEEFFKRAMTWGSEGAGMTVRAELSALSQPDIEAWKSAKSAADSEVSDIRSEMKSNPSVMGDRAFLQKYNAVSQRRQFINEGLQVLTGEKQPQPRTMELLNQGASEDTTVGAPRRMSKAAADRIEKLRKYREAMIGTEGGRKATHIPATEATAKIHERAYDLPTPQSISDVGAEAMSQPAPSYQDFMSRLRLKHGAQIQPGQVAEAWADSVWKKLNSATGAELKAMVDKLGLRRQVFGQIKRQGTTIQLQGDIADAGKATPSIELLRSKAIDKSSEILKRAEKMDKAARSASASLDKATRDSAPKMRQRAMQLRSEAEAMTRAAKTGEGVKLSQPSLFGGESEVMPADWHDPRKGPMTKNRDKAIATIGKHLIQGRVSLREGLQRKSVGPEDIRYDESGGGVLKVGPDDLSDLDELGMALTANAATDATTQRIAGGGRFKVKEDALPRSATKRVVALFDRYSKKVYLVSAYRDGRRGPVFLNPVSVTGEHQPLSELAGRFQPIYSVPLDTPVQNFRQEFSGVKEFSDKFERQMELHGRRVGWKGFGSNPSIEGTEGLRGQGGFVTGPQAEVEIARAAAGIGKGARDIGVDITEPEAREVYRRFRHLENREDAARLIADLRAKAEANALKPEDWMLITAMSKVNESLRSEDLYKGITEKVTEHGEVSTGLYQETLDALYGLAKNNETEGSFVRATQRQFGEGLPVSDEAAQAEVPQESGKELTMPFRRIAPTVVRPEQVPAGTKPISFERGLGQRPIKRDVPYGQRTARSLWEDRYRMDRLARKQNAPRKPDIVSYPSSGLDIAPPTGDSYAMPEYRRKLIEQKINEQMNNAEINRIVKALNPEQPKPAEAPSLKQTSFEDRLGIGSLRRPQYGTSFREKLSNLLTDFGSFYDSWMVNRIAEYGGPDSKQAAETFNYIIDREKQLYGQLTPVLDRARKLSGGIESNPTMTLGQKVKGSVDAVRAAHWLNGMERITPNAAVSRTVAAIEGMVNVPPQAKELVDAARAANMEIGAMLQPVIPGFSASGKFQRNLTALGYDIIRQGDGDLWERWTNGIAAANHRRGVPTAAMVTEVQNNMRMLKELLDDPVGSGDMLERVNQDFARLYPVAITHVKGRLGTWQPVLHADLFNYLENAARRATHVRAFRESFPNNERGRSMFRQMMDDVRAELPDEPQRDLNALIRALHGHPTDDYAGEWQDYTRMGPQQGASEALRMVNQTVGNLMAKAVLTGQMITQGPELAAGSTPVFLGYGTYLRALARVRQLYPELELHGAVNKVMHDFTFNRNSPIRSSFRIAGNVISKLSMQNMLNEAQEAMAAASARITTEDIRSGNLSDWQKSMLPSTFRIMGFNPGEVQRMMAGDYELLGEFQRRAAAFLTGGNKSVAEGSRMGSNRFINSIFRFQTYPMMKMNQTRRVLLNMVDAWENGTTEEKTAATKMAGRFLFGNSIQGAALAGMTALMYGGASGLKIRMNEAKDEPFKFMAEAFLGSVSGPLYLVWRGAREKGLLGVGEQATRLAFPYGMMNDFNDMAQGFGQYKDLDSFDRVGRFLMNKTPGTKAIKTGFAMFGLGTESQKLEQAMAALGRWRRSELGWVETKSFLEADERAEFRTQIKKALEAMRSQDDAAFTEAWSKAVDESDPKAVAQSIKSRKVLVGPTGKALDEDQLDALRTRIGKDAFERLEYYDLMLDQAAYGVMPTE